MVMHASKYQRLNDGYYDRTKSHQYEDKYPSKNHGYNERYNERHDSPSRRGSSRDRSPTSRYHNKVSYIERNKERLQKGSSSSPADRRLNHNSSSHDDRSDRKVSKTSRKDKPDIQKSALRICGDWSEHLSSKGKKYYYNIKTEDSKWEKPKEWHDSQASGVGKERERQNGREQSRHHSSNKYGEKNRHSSSSSSSAEKRDSQQRLAKSFSTPIRAPVSTSTSGSGSLSSLSSHHHHQHTVSSSSSSYSRTYSERANSSYSSQRLHNSTSEKGGGVSRGSSFSSSHSTSAMDGHSDHKDSRTMPHASKSSGYDRHYSSSGAVESRRDDMSSSRRGGSGQHDELYNKHRQQHHQRNDSVNSAYNDSAYNGARSVDSYRNDTEDSRQTEDMDISPGSTPSNSRPGSRSSSRMGTPIVSTPGASATTKSGSTMNAVSGGSGPSSHSTERSPGGKQDGQNLTQTLQSLQILQKLVLVQHQLQKQQKQQQQQNIQHQQPVQMQQHHQHSQQHHHHHHHHRQQQLNTSGGDKSPVSEGTPTYEPSHLPPWETSASGGGGGGAPLTVGGEGIPCSLAHTDTDRGPGRQSPRSDCSVKSSKRSSPSRSEESSHGSLQQQVSTSSLAAAATKNKQNSSVHLTPSLSNYYNERLVEHVQGWPSDTIEIQGNQLAQEGHLVGSQHCTQVSVELKRARSLVRIAEIQSTLQEQRVLFLKQQIADLERSQNTYMPPSSADT